MRTNTLLALALWTLGCGVEPLPAPIDKVEGALTERVGAGEETDVLVEIAATSQQQGLQAPGADRPDPAAREAAFAQAKARALSSLGPHQGVRVVRALEHLPVMHLKVRDLDALRVLAGSEAVLRVHADQRAELALTRSLPLIHQPEAAAQGVTGGGVSVAVLDTGVDYARAAFGPCTAPGTPASCKVAYAADFAPEDNALDAHGHGTNVAAIVLGVAPEARVLALDVFDGGYAYSSAILAAVDWCIAHRAEHQIVAMNLSLGGGLYPGACPEAVYASSFQAAREAGILPVVASGNGGDPQQISAPACVPAAVSVGAVYSADFGALSFSVCSDAATAADQVTCFSNSGPTLTLLAPGAFISAGGATMAGTSQATPHVAGAVALMRSAFPSESAEDALQRLRASGVAVTDPRNGRTTPRLDLAGATAGCFYALSPSSLAPSPAGGSYSIAVSTGAGCAWTASSSASWLTVTSGASGTGPGTVAVTVSANAGGSRAALLTVGPKSLTVTQGVDSAGPTGALAIIEGAATRSLSVHLALSATDPSGVAQMCLTNATACAATAWVSYATSATWKLPSGGAGTRTVRAWFKDSRGNVSAAPATDSILYDATLPTNGTLQALGSSGRVDLSWSGFADAHSGLAGYRVVAAPTTAPASCATGTVVYEGAATGAAHTGLIDGTTWGYRVCALDVAGNLSTGAKATARPAPEYVGPVGALTINGGEAYTRVTSVTLALSATDASGVASMCISKTAACTTFVPYATSYPWKLSTTNGAQTVYATFRDVYGNVGAPASARITLDTVKPSGSTLSASASSGQVALSWTAATDALSGVAGYQLRFAPGAAPASCTAGILAYAGAATGFTHAGLTDGATYGYRLCIVDVAGNVGAGPTASARPAPEYQAPTGSVAINAGATYTRTAAVTLTIAGSDPSGVAAMCVSNSATCSLWVPFASTYPWKLTTTNGTRTVYVSLRDRYGNASLPFTATIVLDTVAPKAGTLTATAGNAQVSLSWSPATDALSGLARYQLRFAAATTPSCTSGSLAYEGPATSFVHAGLSNGTAYGYRLCSVDVAGNVGSGPTAVARPLAP